MRIKKYRGGDENQKFQGDISILKVEKADVEFSPFPENGLVVGHSESGHNHKVVKDREAEIEFAQDTEGFFIRIKSGTAQIIHEKVGGHDSQVLDKGLYFIGRQMEYTDLEDKVVRD